MNDGYMDAAAVPVPDAGDDALYLSETATEVIWHAEGVGSIEREDAEELGRDIRDALLPRIREHVAAAVQAERERVLRWAADECRREARWRLEKHISLRIGTPEYDMRTEGQETASKLEQIIRQEANHGRR